MLAKDSNLSQNNRKIWIISDGRYSDIDLKGLVDGDISGPYKQYEISDIGRYLLNPQSIEVKKKLIGGEIHYKQGALKKIGKSFLIRSRISYRQTNPWATPDHPSERSSACAACLSWSPEPRAAPRCCTAS